ncbi:MAG: hypothetical protein K2X87_13070 [Gemmataceae bacterium]|nr:hypothetical protein [Gemmataceae bacterium]
MYTLLAKTQPDAIAAFEGYLVTERERAARFADTFTAKGKGEYLRDADSEEFRLTVFDRWLRGEGRRRLRKERGLPAVPVGYAERGRSESGG